MKRLLVLNGLILGSLVFSYAQITSPEQFFGYKPGENFTEHHKVQAYFHLLDKESEKATFRSYGKTWEGRELFVIILSDPENLKNLEQIRLKNLSLTGLINDFPSEVDNKLIIWLSYGVHGNETSSTEAAILTAYELLATHESSGDWLKNSVIIIDPCLNPDGRERYINWYRQVKSNTLDAGLTSYEHNEPYPGGRANHYYFDLNRDWSWATQQETRDRIRLYNEWMPHIHVDFHEQGINNPYYFAPAAEPYHQLITSWQRSFQRTIGENNARYFDKNYWLYFTKERFDLFYPGYGDTYPIFNGAIGMTYEQSGGGDAGLAVIMDTGDTLFLKDRVQHHLVTGLSTIEISNQHAVEIIRQFKAYFNHPATVTGNQVKTYIIPAKDNSVKWDKLRAFFDLHKIRYGYNQGVKIVKGIDYRTKKEKEVRLQPGDLIIPVSQSKQTLVQVLFDPHTPLTDSLTYDITSWALPYAFNLECYELKEPIEFSTESSAKISDPDISRVPYALAFNRNSVDDLRILSHLLDRKIKVRTNLNPATFDGIEFERGSFFLMKADNLNAFIPWEQLYKKLADNFREKMIFLNSGLSQSGQDMGSPDFNLLKAPRVGLMAGNDVSSGRMGEVWYFFEQELKYPVIRLNSEYIRFYDLKDFDVLILPGGPHRYMNEEFLEKLNSWISGGGRLIVMGSVLSRFTDKDNFELKTFLDEAEKEKIEDLKAEPDYYKKYEERERMELRDFISGGIFQTELDPTHPLAFGLGKEYYTLKLGDDRYSLLENGWNVCVIEDYTRKVSGFAGVNTRASLYKALVFGVEEKGEGEMVYMVDNPLFRAFWESGKLIMGNAIFMP